MLAVPEGCLDLVLRAAEAEGVAAVRLGTTGGELLAIQLAAELWPPDGAGADADATEAADLPAESSAAAAGSLAAASAAGSEAADLAGSSEDMLVFDVAELAAASDAVLRSLFD